MLSLFSPGVSRASVHARVFSGCFRSRVDLFLAKASARGSGSGGRGRLTGRSGTQAFSQQKAGWSGEQIGSRRQVVAESRPRAAEGRSERKAGHVQQKAGAVPRGAAGVSASASSARRSDSSRGAGVRGDCLPSPPPCKGVFTFPSPPASRPHARPQVQAAGLRTPGF